MSVYTVVETNEWEQARGERYGCPAGIDFYTETIARRTWPEDGSIYAGITYEQRTVWIGPVKGMRHVQVSSSNYPAK